MEYYKSVKVWIAHADTRVHKIQELTDISEFDFDVYGRGGTDFIQPIEHVTEEIEPDIILYFTDGYGTPPPVPPKPSIVWFITEGGMDPTAHLGTPYGEVVYVKYN
jgi:predicted metal-dependent peptidase